MASMWGIVTFYSSQHAIHAEKVLKQANFAVELVPGPKEISPNCGVALKCLPDEIDEVAVCLQQANVRIEACHRYELHDKKSLLDKLLGR